MRLNEKTYPAIAKLEDHNYLHIPIDEVFIQEYTQAEMVVLMGMIQKNWNKAGGRRFYLSTSFKDAMSKVIDKLPMTDVLAMTTEETGIMITDKGHMVYSLNPSESPDVLFEVSGFTKNTGALTCHIIVDKDQNVGGVWAVNDNGVFKNDIHFGGSFAYTIMCVIYFMHNCEIDTKVLEPNEKYRANKEKYFNESKRAITMLDCRWFTTLVSNIPFNVTGHFRWQPHGSGRSLRKLIWIEDFKKHGYHRRADKEIQHIQKTNP